VTVAFDETAVFPEKEHTFLDSQKHFLNHNRKRKMKFTLFQLLTLVSATSAFAPQNAMTSRCMNVATTTRTTFAASTLDTNDDTEVQDMSSEETLAMQMKAQEMEVRKGDISEIISIPFAQRTPFNPFLTFYILKCPTKQKEVTMELVAKYVSAGKSQEYAQQEVDKFLSDPERSEKYLDMRRYAKAQANELMGFESILVIGGAFALGLTGNVLIKYISAYKQVYPSGDGPIPFL